MRAKTLRERVHDLKQLVRAYQLGWIKETRSEDQHLVKRSLLSVRNRPEAICKIFEKTRQKNGISSWILGKTENNGQNGAGALLFLYSRV